MRSTVDLPPSSPASLRALPRSKGGKSASKLAAKWGARKWIDDDVPALLAVREPGGGRPRPRVRWRTGKSVKLGSFMAAHDAIRKTSWRRAATRS